MVQESHMIPTYSSNKYLIVPTNITYTIECGNGLNPIFYQGYYLYMVFMKSLFYYQPFFIVEIKLLRLKVAKVTSNFNF